MARCPMTTRIKGHPFEVVVQIDGIDSAILSSIRSNPWIGRYGKAQANVKAVVSAGGDA
jgi:mRNA interferase MazF